MECCIIDTFYILKSILTYHLQKQIASASGQLLSTHSLTTCEWSRLFRVPSATVALHCLRQDPQILRTSLQIQLPFGDNFRCEIQEWTQYRFQLVSCVGWTRRKFSMLLEEKQQKREAICLCFCFLWLWSQKPWGKPAKVLRGACKEEVKSIRKDPSPPYLWTVLHVKLIFSLLKPSKTGCFYQHPAKALVNR